MAHPTRLERVASTFGEQRSLYARQPRNNLFMVASSGASRPAVFPERCISTRSAICRGKHPAEQESRSITSQQWRTVIARAVGRRVGLLCTRIIVPLQMATISECRYRWLRVHDLNLRNLSRTESNISLALHDTNHTGGRRKRVALARRLRPAVRERRRKRALFRVSGISVAFPRPKSSWTFELSSLRRSRNASRERSDAISVRLESLERWRHRRFAEWLL